jgi:multiple sugar transport system permease protein
MSTEMRTQALIPGYLKPANERAAEWAQQMMIFLVISLILLPIFWIAITSIKVPRDVYSLDNALWFKPTLENFVTIFEHPWNLASKLFNSLLVAIGTVLIAMPLALGAA